MIRSCIKIVCSIVLRPCSLLRQHGVMSSTHSFSEALYAIILLIVKLLNMFHIFSQANEYRYFCGVKVSYLWQRRKYMTVNAW